MKFLIDAHLPPSLRTIFQAAGHDAIHTLDLPDQNASRDRSLNEISMAEERVIITKDSDFYFSHLLQGRPWKLVMVRTGNMSLRSTKQMFKTHLPEIEDALHTHTLVELSSQNVTPIQ